MPRYTRLGLLKRTHGYVYIHIQLSSQLFIIESIDSFAQHGKSIETMDFTLFGRHGNVQQGICGVIFAS